MVFAVSPYSSKGMCSQVGSYLESGTAYPEKFWLCDGVICRYPGIASL